MPDKSQIIFFIIIPTILIFLLAGLIITILYFYQKRQIIYEKNLNALKLDFEKNILKTQVEIQEQTFQNISREIHDNISLSLTLAKLNLNTINWNENQEIKKTIDNSVQIISSAITDLSDLSKSLNPDLIQNIGFIKAIKIEIEKLYEMAHLSVKYEINGEPIFMDSEKELILFRIIQESFNNIVKHSKATKVWLTLNYKFNYLQIIIRDNGIGFNTQEILGNIKGSQAGLTNMQTRAKLFGGYINVDSCRQNGTQILVTVPF